MYGQKEVVSWARDESVSLGHLLGYLTCKGSKVWEGIKTVFPWPSQNASYHIKSFPHTFLAVKGKEETTQCIHITRERERERDANSQTYDIVDFIEESTLGNRVSGFQPIEQSFIFTL